ncbi:MAG: hypothetical protein VZQ47_13035, partial [Treponema sp.]|nr:hypothetical protein [Treponema sp.]
YPGLDENGKFTNGDFNNPLVPPSFIPAETINLLLDNMGGFINHLGGEANNHGANQVSAAFAAYIQNLMAEITDARNNQSEALKQFVSRTSRNARLGFPYGKERFVTFDFTDENHRSVKIAKDVHIRLDIPTPDGMEQRWFDTDEVRSFNLNSMIQEAVSRTATRTNHDEGRDFYGYLVPDFETENGVKIVVSCNATYPNDISESYTAANTRKIFSFHTLCANAGSNLQGKIAESPSCGLVAGDKVLVKQYPDDEEDGFYDFYDVPVISVAAKTKYDVVTVRHPLAGFLSGQILPESVFCLSFRPEAEPAGMLYDIDTDIAADIYLQSGKGRGTASEFGATITDTREQQNHQDDMRHVRKRLLHDHEFSSIALGSNEGTSIQGAADPGTTGGHVAAAGSRMISFIGCEDCCGAMWQWLEEVSANGSSEWSTYDGQADFGGTYGASYALLAGALWNNSSLCGSRARGGNNARSTVDAIFGGRGASRMKKAS